MMTPEERRQYALSMAITAGISAMTDEMVITRAQRFEEFLAGKPTAQTPSKKRGK